MWHGMVQYSRVRFGMVWCCAAVWYDMVWVVQCGMVWCGAVWYGRALVWRVVVWYRASDRDRRILIYVPTYIHPSYMNPPAPCGPPGC